MEFFEVVKNRYSYRKKLDPAQLPIEDLKKIVQAGLDAPSGKNAQTTGFLIITDPGVVAEIHSIPGGNAAVSTAPAYIAFHVSKDPEKIFHEHFFDIEDCAASCANILLAATALDYATVWIDGWLRLEERAEKIGRLCGLDNDRIIRIIIPIGKPLEEEGRREKMPFDARVKII